LNRNRSLLRSLVSAAKRIRFFYSLLSFYCLLTLLGCASLPTVKDVVQDPIDPERPPTIVGAHGPLSPRKSRAIMERLRREDGSADLLKLYVAFMEQVTGNPLVAGNRVTLLIDGPATYKAMFTAIEGATDHIHLETYIFEEDEVGRRFADLLLKKQAQGVSVNLIYDSYGSSSASAAFFQRLRNGGIQTVEFNPVNLLKTDQEDVFIHRDHRKILVVDGKVAFTGGVNVSAVYSRSLSGRLLEKKEKKATEAESWRDTHVQIEGPAVSEFQKLFLDTWTGQKGPELPKRNYYPKLKKEGDALVQVVGSKPGQPNRLTYLMYLSAITFSERSIDLTSPYFVPDHETLKALKGASKRGIRVRLILPGTSDEGFIFYAGRSYYADLLESGVRLYELGGTVLHAKTAVIDGIWSTVGSTNMDLWSFLRNDEVNAVVLSKEFAAEMEDMFENDLKESKEILLEQWEKRPFSERLKEWFARLFAHWL